MPVAVTYANNAAAQAFRRDHGPAFVAWAQTQTTVRVRFRDDAGSFAAPVTVTIDQIEVLNGLHTAGEGSATDPNTGERVTIHGSNHDMRTHGNSVTGHYRPNGTSIWIPNVYNAAQEAARKANKLAANKRRREEKKKRDQAKRDEDKKGGSGGGKGGNTIKTK